MSTENSLCLQLFVHALPRKWSQTLSATDRVQARAPGSERSLQQAVSGDQGVDHPEKKLQTGVHGTILFA